MCLACVRGDDPSEPPALVLRGLALVLPVAACGPCAGLLRALEARAAAPGGSRVDVEAALGAIEGLGYFGAGDRRTNAARAGAFAAAAIPMAALAAAGGVLAGLAGGAVSGFVGGGLAGVALGADVAREKEPAERAGAGAAAAGGGGGGGAPAAAVDGGSTAASPAAAALMKRALATLKLPEAAQAANAEAELARIALCKTAYAAARCDVYFLYAAPI